MMSFIRAVKALSLAAVGLGLSLSSQVHAQTPAWPSKPLRFVVGFPAGSITDSVARVLAEHLRGKLGQPVVVENRPGANGVLGVTEAARAAPDGYTILVTNSSSITVNPQLYKKLSYETRDFTPVSMVVSAPFILVVNPNNERTAAVNTLADFLALSKSKAGQLSYGSAGLGNLAHLSFETINNRAGIKTVHVPYKASSAAQIGLLGKEIDVLLDTPVASQQIQAGRLKALAVTSNKRWRDLPNVPTFAEAGLPGIDVTFWLGVLVPTATPAPIVQALAQAIQSVREDANAMKQLAIQGVVDLSDPTEFAARVRSETAAWGEVIRRENIQLD